MFGPFNPDVIDEFSEVPLEEINPVSKRTRSLFARNRANPAAKEGLMNILGAIDMIDGLEYHHDAFMRIIQKVSEIPFFSDIAEDTRKGLIHETIAYLNRMGQFWYFANSEFVKRRVKKPEEELPTIKKFKPFRDKHGAHRSLDKPLKEDSQHLQLVHAWAISSFSGMHFSKKTNCGVPPIESLNPKEMWLKKYASFQMLGENSGQAVNFSVEKEHPLIAKEAYQLLERILIPQRPAK